MPNIDSPPKKSFGDLPQEPTAKYKQFDAELKLVHTYLFTRVATATMVATELDIYRPNLCRHVANLAKQGLLIVLFKSACQVTGWQANYLTCSPEMIKRFKDGL